MENELFLWPWSSDITALSLELNVTLDYFLFTWKVAYCIVFHNGMNYKGHFLEYTPQSPETGAVKQNCFYF